MPTQRLEIERVSLISPRSFEAVVDSLKAGVGRLNLADFGDESQRSSSFAELQGVIEQDLGPSGLMLFLELDHGAVLRNETGLATPKVVRLIVGNPLIGLQMVRHVPEAGSYAPVTILVDERPDGVHVSHDRMASGSLNTSTERLRRCLLPPPASFSTETDIRR